MKSNFDIIKWLCIMKSDFVLWKVTLIWKSCFDDENLLRLIRSDFDNVKLFWYLIMEGDLDEK